MQKITGGGGVMTPFFQSLGIPSPWDLEICGAGQKIAALGTRMEELFVPEGGEFDPCLDGVCTRPEMIPDPE